MVTHAINAITPTYVDGTPATAVAYTRSKSELTNLRDNIQAAIEAGFNGWKNLCGSSDFAFLDLSTTSRGSIDALGHNVRYIQQGANEADPDASWMSVASCNYAQKMDCYI